MHRHAFDCPVQIFYAIQPYQSRLYDGKPTDKREQYDLRAEKNCSGLIRKKINFLRHFRGAIGEKESLADNENLKHKGTHEGKKNHILFQKMLFYDAIENQGISWQTILFFKYIFLIDEKCDS